MLLILQRYYFESESQPPLIHTLVQAGCCLSYKDTILKANHNSVCSRKGRAWMLLILQRYYFESESQPMRQFITHRQRCCLSYKDTILKANHNHSDISFERKGDVAYPTKILF